MRITVLTGGIGGARFLEGVRAARPDASMTAVVNTADDVTVLGLRVCPDLDSVMYTLGGGIDQQRRWGRADEGWRARDELADYGHEDAWFGLGDRDLATHLVRSERLRTGARLTEVTQHLCERWRPGVRLLPMCDHPVETRVRRSDGGGEIHLQEYWIRHRGELPVDTVRVQGIEDARPTPEVVDALASADVVLLAPSNPVVSIGPILQVPGLSGLLRDSRAPVVGVSPIIDGGHVRGMANQLLRALGREVSAAGVGEHYAARSRGGVLDGWLVDAVDAECVGRLADAGVTARARPLWMDDAATTRALAEDALLLAEELAS